VVGCGRERGRGRSTSACGLQHHSYDAGPVDRCVPAMAQRRALATRRGRAMPPRRGAGDILDAAIRRHTIRDHRLVGSGPEQRGSASRAEARTTEPPAEAANLGYPNPLALRRRAPLPAPRPADDARSQTESQTHQRLAPRCDRAGAARLSC